MLDKCEGRPASRPTANTITTEQKITTRPPRPAAIPAAYVDPFSDERRMLAETIVLREAWLSSLGLRVPERYNLEELRRLAAWDRMIGYWRAA